VKPVSVTVGPALLALALGACATANTPAQNLAYDRWAKCSSAYAQLDRIGLDGRITFLITTLSDRQRIVDCLTEAGRGGPALPEPVAVRPPGGP
jgi:hypothetical protein